MRWCTSCSMLVQASAARSWVVGSSIPAVVELSLSARRDSDRASRSSAVTTFAEGGSGQRSSSSSVTSSIVRAPQPRSTGPSIESRVAVVLRRPRLRSTRPDQEGRLQRAFLPQPVGHGRAGWWGWGCGPVRSCARSAPDGLRCRRAGRKPGQAPAVGRVGAAGPAAPSERARRPTAAAPLGSLVAYMVMHRRPYEPTFRVLAGPITAAGRVSPGQRIW